jgi:hypothetical protein
VWPGPLIIDIRVSWPQHTGVRLPPSPRVHADWVEPQCSPRSSQLAGTRNCSRLQFVDSIERIVRVPRPLGSGVLEIQISDAQHNGGNRLHARRCQWSPRRSKYSKDRPSRKHNCSVAVCAVSFLSGRSICKTDNTVSSGKEYSCDDSCCAFPSAWQ